jgi:hypothetical protein
MLYPDPTDWVRIWTETKNRIVGLVAGLPPERLSAPVQPGSESDVNAVLAHLVDSSARIGQLQPITVCTAEQALPSPDPEPIELLLKRWDELEAGACAALDADEESARILITDHAMHEHDLRMVLDRPGARDDDAIRVALTTLSRKFSDRIRSAGMPPLRITVEQWGTIAGGERATRCLVADRFEFVRGLSGRRSASEGLRWNWGSHAEVYIPLLASGPLPTEEFHERDPRIPEHMKEKEFVL